YLSCGESAVIFLSSMDGFHWLSCHEWPGDLTPKLQAPRELKLRHSFPPQGGSSGKGTTLNYRSDVDLVLFLSCFPSFQDQAEHRGSVISFIEKRLTECSSSLAYSITVIPQRETTRVPRSLSFEVQPTRNSEAIGVDVLPAYDALTFPSCPQCDTSFFNLLRVSYSFSLPFENYFGCGRQWGHLYFLPRWWTNCARVLWLDYHLKPKYQNAALPPKYALELLTIYAWEIGTDKSDNFNLDEGFRAVMELLIEYEDICIYWTKYYDFQNETVRIYIKQPVILDPADPTNNLGSKKRWDLVAREAVRCLRQACCRTEDSSQGWNVQPARDVQVTVKKTGEEAWTLSVNPYSPIWKMKAEIRRTWGFSGQQRLSFQEPGGERRLLGSQQTLAYYGIFSKVSIRVLETFPPEIQVFVKDSGGQSKPYAMYPEDFIYVLKEKIEEAGGPYVEDQILTFQNRELWNYHRLSDLSVPSPAPFHPDHCDFRKHK
uniref:Ubiquitin-like domain-containing protein n=1 Tax=Ursus americanus TaxID=9643 RepID=A0A452SA69_URSAM